MAAATRKVRVGTVRNVCRWAGVMPLGLVVAHVTSWLAAGNYAPWTRRKYLEHVRCFAGFAGIPDPTAGLRPPPHPRGLPRPVSEADLGRLLAAAVGPERAWVLLGAFCGLRSAETAKVRDVDVLNGATGLDDTEAASARAGAAGCVSAGRWGERAPRRRRSTRRRRLRGRRGRRRR